MENVSLLQKRQIQFVIFLPVFNVLASILTPFFAGAFNPGVFRGIVLTLFFVWFLIVKFKLNRFNRLFFIYMLYVLVLCFLSDDILTSLYIYNKFFICSMMFFVGITYINTNLKFLHLLRSFMVGLILLIVYLGISNVFNIGTQTYKDESVYFGETGVNITKSLTIFLIILPLYIRLETNRIYRVIAIYLIFIAATFVLLGMKRSSILALLSGFFFYFLLTPYKGRIVSVIPIVLGLLVLASPYIFPIIEKRFSARQQRVSMTYNQLRESETEGRVVELQLTIQESFSGNFSKLFIGYNVFLKKDYLGHQRMLHVDYTNMLGGAGIFGLFLFVIGYLNSLFNIRKLYLKLKSIVLMREFFAVSASLIAIQAFLSIGGTLQGVTLRGYILLLLGAITRIMYVKYTTLKSEVKSA